MNLLEKMTQRHKEQGYTPMFLSWARSYDHEEKEMRSLITSNCGDVKMLKNEYQQLTGKRFRRSSHE